MKKKPSIRLDERIVDAAVRRIIAQQSKAVRVEPAWLPIRPLGERNGHSRVTVWRNIGRINGSITADNGPIRRRQLSPRLVVFSVADYDREMERLSRSYARSA